MSAPHAAGFVLAGGMSSRMGRDKALLELSGKPLITYAIDRLASIGLSAAIVGDRPDLENFAPVVPDGESGLGPLQGVCAALAQSSVELNLFLTVDTPLLSVSALEYLLLHARISGSVITLLAVNGFGQTFPAVVRRTALPALHEQLQSGRRGCFAAFQAAALAAGESLRPVAVEALVQTGQVTHPAGLPPAHWFLNVNTPADLAAAQSVAARIA